MTYYSSYYLVKWQSFLGTLTVLLTCMNRHESSIITAKFTLLAKRSRHIGNTEICTVQFNQSANSQRHCLKKNKKAHQLVGQCETLCEIASFSSFREFPKRLFCDGEVGEESGGVNAIWCRPEVVDDVISCEDADIFQAYSVCMYKFVCC